MKSDPTRLDVCCVLSPRPLAASQQPLNATSHHSAPIINLQSLLATNPRTLHLTMKRFPFTQGLSLNHNLLLLCWHLKLSEIESYWTIKFPDNLYFDSLTPSKITFMELPIKISEYMKYFWINFAVFLHSCSVHGKLK